ncbi:putative NF-kappa-B inhibitor zeta-like [Scophthalmus maximus]|uniref:Putative NF-kappa-B inhibitor zeta-like n=1 Tax=Scophthalmus maximus TaxID=52904 RepID=A0A2U9B3L1_SCOMX|nr:putative NF-kappa-B inhibitor zeta-like [Scophthalmus maximus]
MGEQMLRYPECISQTRSRQLFDGLLFFSRVLFEACSSDLRVSDATGGRVTLKTMRGRFKRANWSDGTADVAAGSCPLPGETAAAPGEPDTPPPVFTVREARGSKKDGRRSIYGGDKVYLGVRVKMPVRDLLRNKRLAQGLEPQDFRDKCGKTDKGVKKRVKTRAGCQTTKRKLPTKSLEELAIIVEVLEEDLRTSNTYRSRFSDVPVSPGQSPTGYNSEDSDEMIPSPRSYMTYSLGTGEYYHQAPSPPGFTHTSITGVERDGGAGEEWFDPQSHNWNLNCSEFFWTQLQKEESQLRAISDAALLATDEYCRTALHKVACVGKRSLGYAIAKRMAALNSLDLKDSDGMTALLHAANHNHHLIVADLICLGASVNETNHSGKSCLHLSAEKGYVRVLEVLKHTMMDGVYVNVEATDNCGMSVLQCASVALKATVCELESSRSPSHTRLHTLRQEQMMETLECLLHMGSYLHTMVGKLEHAT